MKNIRLLQDEIHTSFDKSLFETRTFDAKISSLSTDHPISHRNDSHMYTHIVQELNRKYHFFGLDSFIQIPVDAGFRPVNLTSFFAGSISLENGSRLLSEDSSLLLLE
tara:strand:- start:2594 stop:2917 length:324 start_codon:yes stop_codon:yes gene_type:complete